MKNTCKFCQRELIIHDFVKSTVNTLMYTLYKCSKCKSYHYDSSEHGYDSLKMYNNFTYTPESTNSKKWRKEKRIIEQLSNNKVNSILDIGCRTGDFLMNFGNDVFKNGVELNTGFAEIANNRGLSVYNESIENVSLPKGFDIVTCYAVLEHVEQPLEFINKVESLVKKDGLLVIMIPTRESFKAKLLSLFNKHWHMDSPPSHLNFCSRKFLDNYLKEIGFKKVSRRYSSGGLLMSKFKIEKYITAIIDKSFINKIPIFDHMYTYYKKN